MSGNNEPKFDGAGKLIGGFASGNLSDQERDALFQAALRDQDVFDALMEEQALKDLLDEPGVKGELIAALQPKVSLLDRVKSFLATPVAWGAMGAVATAALLLVVILPTKTRDVAAPQTAQVRPDAEEKALRQTPSANAPAAAQPAPPQPKETAPARVMEPAPPPVQSIKEQERREAPGAPPPPAATVQSQERDRQQQQAAPPMQSPAMQQQEQLSVQRPMPAASVGAVGQILAVDYALLRRAPDGSYQAATTVRATDAIRLQVMPSESGFISLYRRTPEGLMDAVAVSQPVNRGQVVQVPQQGSINAGDGTYVLMLSRDGGSADQAKKSEEVQGFRQSNQSARAKRTTPAAPGASGAAGALLDLSTRKTILPSVALGRAVANSPDDRTVAVEFTIRIDN